MSEPLLVTCYVDPDLDGVAGSVAYAEFLCADGQNAIAGIIGTPHIEARYVLERFDIPVPKAIPNADSFESVILVDGSDLKGLEGKIAPEKVIEIIDHRALHDSDQFPNAKAQIELVGAAATLVAERFIQEGVDISRSSAILLYGAILSGTLNFRNSITTNRDRIAAQWLNQGAQLPENFWRELFTAKSDLAGNKLQEVIRHDFSQFDMNRRKVGIAQIEMMGADLLMQKRKEEVLQILDTLKCEKNLDMIFLSFIELNDCKNLLIARDPEIQGYLEKALNVRFTGVVAERAQVLMRKQR